MARDILKSNNSIVIAGQRPAFTTGDRTGSDMNGAYMSTVQSVSVGFSQQRQKSKQVGSKGLAVNDITRMPDVDLSINYYYTPAMLNENMLGLINDQISGKSDFFSDYDNQDQNFYIVNHQNQESDIIRDKVAVVNDLNSDTEIISIGNAFLTNYSLGFSVGSQPIVSTSYKCSNVRMEKGNFDECENPAINLQSGNNQGVGVVQLENADVSGFGDYTGINRFDAPLCSPTELTPILQNLQIGGAPIAGVTHLQSFSFSIPINRVDLFGLGSDYPYGRKVQYPISSSVAVEFLVSGLGTGDIAALITNESDYDFGIRIPDTGEDYVHTFSFSGLKLESSNYTMNVNEQMTYSLSFSYEITN